MGVSTAKNYYLKKKSDEPAIQTCEGESSSHEEEVLTMDQIEDPEEEPAEHLAEKDGRPTKNDYLSLQGKGIFTLLRHCNLAHEAYISMLFIFRTKGIPSWESKSS